MQPFKLYQKIIIRTFSFILALNTFNMCPAQSTIHGKIFNSKNEPAINASVLLLVSKDSSLIKAMVCDNAGIYSFNNIHDGSYLITTNLLGHKQAYSNVFITDKSHKDIHIANITLAEETAHLNDVTVTIKKPLLEQKIDR